MVVLGDIIITTDFSLDSKNFDVKQIHSIDIQCNEAAIGFQRYLRNASFFLVVHTISGSSSLSTNNLKSREIIPTVPLTNKGRRIDVFKKWALLMDLLIPCVPRGIYLSWNISVTIDTAHDATFFKRHHVFCDLMMDVLTSLFFATYCGRYDFLTADFNTFSTQRLNWKW